MTVTIEAQDGDVIELVSPRQKLAPSVEITEHTIEGGGQISDHAEQKPLDFTVTGRVSEQPFRFPGRRVHEKSPSEAREFFQKIAEVPVTVVTERLGTFTNSLLQEWNHEVTTEQAIVFELRFRQIRIATFEAVTIPPAAPAPPQQAGAPDEQDTGRQATQQRSPQKSGGDNASASAEGTPDEAASEQSDQQSASTLHNLAIGG